MKTYEIFVTDTPHKPFQTRDWRYAGTVMAKNKAEAIEKARKAGQNRIKHPTLKIGLINGAKSIKAKRENESW